MLKLFLIFGPIFFTLLSFPLGADVVDDKKVGSKLTCFEPGACSESYHVGGDSKQNKNECLEFCKSKQGSIP